MAHSKDVAALVSTGVRRSSQRCFNICTVYAEKGRGERKSKTGFPHRYSYVHRSVMGFAQRHLPAGPNRDERAAAGAAAEVVQ